MVVKTQKCLAARHITIIEHRSSKD